MNEQTRNDGKATKMFAVGRYRDLRKENGPKLAVRDAMCDALSEAVVAAHSFPSLAVTILANDRLALA